jgi:hypothetical protein
MLTAAYFNIFCLPLCYLKNMKTKILYRKKNIISSVVLYGGETWSLTWEKHTD